MLSFQIQRPWIIIIIFMNSCISCCSLNPNGTGTLLANGLSAFFINSNSTFDNGPRSLPRKSLDCFTLFRQVFDNFTFFDELFTKALQRLATCVLVNNFVWLVPILSEHNLKVTPVPFLLQALIYYAFYAFNCTIYHNSRKL